MPRPTPNAPLTGHFERRRRVGGEQQVLRLQVHVGDGVVMQVLHGQAQLSEELAHHALRQPAPGPDQQGEVAAATQLHHDVHVTGGGRVG